MNMTIDFSQLSTYIWIATAALVLIGVIVVIRFFWQHVVKFLIHIGLIVLGIAAVLALLHYFNIF